MWKNQAQAEGFITAMHNMLRGTYASTHLFTLGELRGGHFIIASGTIDGSTLGAAGANQTIIRQIISETSPGVTNFCGYMGFVANCNEGIARIGAASYLNEENRNYMLGMLYGMRAFAFFDMHRTFGKVVLRTETDVIDGIYDPTKLYLARSECSEVMAQIKKDLQSSFDCFDKAYANDSAIDLPFYQSAGYCYLLVIRGDRSPCSGRLSMERQSLYGRQQGQSCRHRQGERVSVGPLSVLSAGGHL